jgi:hypothetical protein
LSLDVPDMNCLFSSWSLIVPIMHFGQLRSMFIHRHLQHDSTTTS